MIHIPTEKKGWKKDADKENSGRMLKSQKTNREEKRLLLSFASLKLLLSIFQAGGGGDQKQS